MTRAWQQSKGAGVTVAVLSTGVSPQAPDLSRDVITGPDYSASGRTPGGAYWGVCGTAVASIIAGHGHGTGNGSGTIGIAPDARILSLRVTLEYDDPLNASGAITQRLPGAIANGILYAVSHGAKVIDLPLDAATFGLAGDSAAAGGSTAERSAVSYALSKGVLLVAAGGDDGETTGKANYPAAYPGVLAVGATGRDGKVGSFSSRSSYVALTAPGVGLMTASMVPDGVSGYAPGYSSISTTSVASGMVAGVAALIMSKYPQLPVAQVTRALRESVTGRASVVNAATAMKTATTLAASIKPVVPAPSPKPKKAVPSAVAAHAPPAHTPAAPRAASAVASSVLRDAVYALGAIIVLLFGVMLATRARRRRTEAQVDAAVAGGGPLAITSGSRPRPGGQHEQQRRRTRAREEAGEPAGDTLTGLRQLARPDSAAVGGWPDASGWQGRGLGEIAHSSLDQGPFGQGSFGQPRPAIEPLPKSASRASRGLARPPWSPAPAPEGAAAPRPEAQANQAPRPEAQANQALLPSSDLSPFPADAEADFRVPGDMVAGLAPFGEAGPPFGDAPMPYGEPPVFGDVPVPYVDIPAPPREVPLGEPPSSPGGLTGPFAGRDVLTQASFGFAAAPVTADYPAPYTPPEQAPPELTHWNPGDSTDPFPALPETLPETLSETLPEALPGSGTGQPDDETA